MISKVTPECCYNCRFFRVVLHDEQESYGLCQRFPPVINEHQSGEADPLWNNPGHWQFPTVFSDLWCGEYEKGDGEPRAAKE